VTSNLHFVITAAVDSDFVNLLRCGSELRTTKPLPELDSRPLLSDVPEEAAKSSGLRINDHPPSGRAWRTRSGLGEHDDDFLLRFHDAAWLFERDDECRRIPHGELRIDRDHH
jgi:hypothetical protein